MKRNVIPNEMSEPIGDTLDLGGLFLRYRDQGDTGAFQILMNALHRPLFNYLLRMLHHRDEAEDALQEVWLKTIRQRDNYREQGQFTSWMYRIAHNHCLDLFRRRKHLMNESFSSEEEETDRMDQLAAQDPSPRDLLHEKESIAQLEEAIAQLPEAIREVYLLRAVHDIPFKEIAEIQKAPLGTVLSRMHQAVNYLRKVVSFSEESAEEMA